MITQILVIAIIVVCGLLCLKARLRNRAIRQIPGPKGLPLIGNLLDAIEPATDILPSALRRANEFGSVFKLWLITEPVVFLSGLGPIEDLLGNRDQLAKGFIYRMTRPWLGNSILISGGERWKDQRKTMRPSFRPNVVKTFLPVFEGNCDVLVDCLARYADTEHAFDLCPLLSRCTLDIICETAMGIRIYAQTSVENLEYTDAIYQLMRLLVERAQRPYLHPDLIYSLTKSHAEFEGYCKVVHDFTENVIRERKAQRAAAGPRENNQNTTFLDHLLDKEVADSDLSGEVNTIMFAGHHTTSTCLSWTLLLLAWHGGAQEQAAAEALAVWPLGEELTPEMIQGMKYIDCVIKESLRMYPPAPLLNRTLEENTMIGAHKVPAGTNITVNLYALHRDETAFPDPESFRPERFREGSREIPPYQWIPFSKGPRDCIGRYFANMEMKAILASILRRYSIAAVDDRYEVGTTAEIVLRSSKGARVTIRSRE